MCYDSRHSTSEVFLRNLIKRKHSSHTNLQRLFVQPIGQMHRYNPIRSFPAFQIFSSRGKKKWGGRLVRSREWYSRQVALMEPAIASNKRLSGCSHLSALLNQAPPLEWGKPLAVLGAGWMEKFSKCGRGSKKEGGTLKNTGIYRQETGKSCAYCRNLNQRKRACYGSTAVFRSRLYVQNWAVCVTFCCWYFGTTQGCSQFSKVL